MLFQLVDLRVAKKFSGETTKCRIIYQEMVYVTEDLNSEKEENENRNLGKMR